MDTLGYGRGWHFNYTQVPNEVFDEKCTLTPIQTLTYLYLLRCVNIEKNGECISWPSHETIGKAIRSSRRGVQEATYVLINKLYIFRKERTKDGLKTSNAYLINHPSYTKDFNVP